jgi:hypothetical protein
MSLSALPLPVFSPTWDLPALPSQRRQDLARRRDRYRTWNLDTEEPEMAGLGRALKRLHKNIRKVALAPVRLVSKKLADNLERLDDKVVDKVDQLHSGVNRFVKRNLKWIIIAAAIAITIYTMGGGAGIAAKMMAGMAKLKAFALSKAATTMVWGKAKYALVKVAMSKLLAGKTFGSLNPSEVSAMAEANQATGEEIVPPEVMSVMRPMPGDAAEGGGGGGAEGGSSFPVVPVAIGGAALLALLAL